MATSQSPLDPTVNQNPAPSGSSILGLNQGNGYAVNQNAALNSPNFSPAVQPTKVAAPAPSLSYPVVKPPPTPIGAPQTQKTPTPSPIVQTPADAATAQLQAEAAKNNAPLSADAQAKIDAAKAQTATPTAQQPLPAPGATTNTDGSVNRPVAATDPIADYYNNLDRTQPDQNAIQQTEKAKMQASIDAINAMYDAELAKARDQGQGRIGSTRAASAATGDLGSVFGDAQLATTQANNTAGEDAIQAQRANAIQGIQDKIDANVTAQLNLQKATADKNSADYISHLQTLQSDAQKNFQALAASGQVDYTTMTADQKAALQKSTGYDDFTATLMFNANKPKAAQKDIQYKVDNGKIYAYSADPATGKITVTSADAPGLANATDIQTVTTPDGVYYYDKNAKPGADGKITMTAIGGNQSPNAKAPGTTGSATIDATSDGYTTSPVAQAGGLTQAAIDKAAIQYATTGTMPSVGLGSTGSAAQKRDAIQARAAELDSTGSISANKSKLSALTTSLGQQTTYLNTMQRSVNTVDDNLDILNGYVSKVNNSSSPLINEIANGVNSKVFGSGDLNAYKSAIQTVRSEYSTILSRGQGATDSTRAEAKTLIPDNISASQLQQVIGVLKAEGENVTKEAQKQVDGVQTSINGIIGGGNLYGNASSTSSSTTTDPVQAAYEKVQKSLGFTDDYATMVQKYGADKVKEVLQQNGATFNEPLSTGGNGSITLGSHLASVNNNPGNLRFVGQAGASQGTGGFAKFDTPEAGVAALKSQIALDASRGHTITSFISKFAPSSENDTSQYISQIATAMGVDPNTPLSTLDLNKLAQVMAKKESSSSIA